MTPIQTERFLREHGFNLLRHGQKHRIYSDGVTRITISSNFGASPRTLCWLKTRVRKAVRERATLTTGDSA